METGIWSFTLGSGYAPVVVRIPQSLLPFPLQRAESIWIEHVMDYSKTVSQLGANGIILNMPLTDMAGDDRLSLAQIASVGTMIRRTAARMQELGVWLFVEIINTPMPAWLSSAGGIDGAEGKSHLANSMAALADALGPAVGIGAVMPDVGLTQPPMGHDNWGAFSSGGSAVRLWKQWRTAMKLDGDDTLPSMKWLNATSHYECPQTKIYEMQRFRSWLFLQRWSGLTATAMSTNSKLKWGCHLPDGRLGLLPGEAEKFGGMLGVDMAASCSVCRIDLGEYPYAENGDITEWIKRSIMMLRLSSKNMQPNLLAEFNTKLTSDAALVKLRSDVELLRMHCTGLVIGSVELATALGKEAIVGYVQRIRRNTPRAFMRLSRLDELAPVKASRLSDLMKAPLVRVQQSDGQWDKG